MREPPHAQARRIAVRIYYEDTDFSGRTYHASYLRFLERGRTEWLRALGLDHATLARAEGLAFVVTKLDIQFLAPARIDDLLDVTTALRELRGPSIGFNQIVLKGEQTLVRASVEVVAVRDGRAVKPPVEMREAARRLRDEPTP